MKAKSKRTYVKCELPNGDKITLSFRSQKFLDRFLVNKKKGCKVLEGTDEKPPLGRLPTQREIEGLEALLHCLRPGFDME